MSRKKANLLEVKKYGDDHEGKRKHPMLMAHPFRLCIVGSSGCGKTNLLCNVVYRWAIFDKLYLYTATPEQPKYVEMIERMADINDKLEAKLGYDPEILTVGTSLDEIPDLEDFNPKLSHLVVIDDLINECNQKRACMLFTSGRPKNISVCYLTQYYFKAPRLVRENLTNMAIFKTRKRSLGMIHTDMGGDLEKDEFMRMAGCCTAKKHDFMWVDDTCDPKMRFRRNISHIYMPYARRFYEEERHFDGSDSRK